MLSSTENRGFESFSLQRRVSCEPRSREKLRRRCHDVDKRGQLRFRAGDAPLPAPTRASRASISQKSSRSAAVKLRTRLRQPRRRQDCDPLPNASCYRNSGRSESGCDTASRSYILRSLDDSAARHPPQDVAPWGTCSLHSRQRRPQRGVLPCPAFPPAQPKPRQLG
jgi:hypothetical protein